MADPIRPGFTPNPQTPQRPDAARSAGQRAFFAAAMGTGPAAATAPQAAAAPPMQSPQRFPVNLPAEPPTKILRPGSLLDIKV